MRSTKKNIAVLVFALSQEEEVKRKPFLKNSYLQQSFTSHIVKMLRKIDLDHYVYGEQEQVGATFGDRFSNAISAIYDKEYDAVITIGNDTPNLNKAHLLQTVEALQLGRSVIGPSFDGGFYLMGLHKETFQQQEFKEFAWNTPSVRKELYAYLNSRNSTWVQLGFLYDLDHVSDVIRVYKSLPFAYKKIKIELQKLITSVSTIAIKLLQIRSSVTQKIFYNKGSPIPTI